MTPFGIVIRWQRDDPSEATSRLLDPIRERSADGTEVRTFPGATVAVGLRAVVPGEDLSWAISVDAPRRRVIVGDVRLYDVEALIRRLDAGSVRDSDLSLVALAVDRFGGDAANHLVGDFAFVVWDWGARRIWAARDHFGLRTLYYRDLTTGFALATDVRQLLEVSDEPKPGMTVDPQAVLSYLLRGRCSRGRSFFREVRQLLPAHSLSAQEGYLRETRYWLPPAEQIVRPNYQEYVSDLSHLFKVAVRDRLRSEYPVASHLSGGLDSGSIVGAAHDLVRDCPGLYPSFTSLSAVFPGLDCDETPFIETVLKRTPLFSSLRWNGCLPNSSAYGRRVLAAPGVFGAPGTAPLGDLPAARSVGARVLLIGLGGDEIGWSRGVFRDVVAGGHFLTLVREMLDLGSWVRCRRNVADGFWALIPGWWEKSFRDARQAMDDQPAWLGPSLAGLAAMPLVGPQAAVTFASNVQREVWKTLTSEESFYQLDGRVLLAAEAGLELRAPYLDVRLANYVLGIPWMDRLPHGDMRRLQRDAVGGFLPDVVRCRLPKPMFESAVSNQMRLNLPKIQEIVKSNEWAAGEFVHQHQVREALAEALQRDKKMSNCHDWLVLFRIAAVEAWLRTVSGYTATIS